MRAHLEGKAIIGIQGVTLPVTPLEFLIQRIV